MLYDLRNGKRSPVWSTETSGRFVTKAEMQQSDGNFVLKMYEQPIKSTRTENKDEYLQLQDDGNLVIYGIYACRGRFDDNLEDA